MSRIARFMIYAFAFLTISLFIVASIRPTISMMGYINEKGILLQKSDENAFKWYERAANLGDKVAQYKLAMQYLEGVGVLHDDDMALAWMHRSAEAGYPPAQFYLAMRFLSQPDIDPATVEQVVDWLRNAAKQGHIPAQRELAKLYLEGRFMEQDQALAVSLLTDTGGQGDADSLRLLAELYRQGQGVDMDSAKASQLERRAIELESSQRK